MRLRKESCQLNKVHGGTSMKAARDQIHSVSAAAMTSEASQVTSRSSNKSELTQKGPEGSVLADVLYQRLGSKWYAFSLIEGETFFSEVPEDLVEAARKRGNAKIEEGTSLAPIPQLKTFRSVGRS